MDEGGGRGTAHPGEEAPLSASDPSDAPLGGGGRSWVLQGGGGGSVKQPGNKRVNRGWKSACDG